MKTSLILLVIFMAFFILVSCDDSNVYREGYIKGAKDTQAAFIAENRNIRSGIKDSLNSKFLIGAVFAVMATLFGATVAECFRRRLAELLSIPIETQILFAKYLYILTILACIFWCLCSYGIIMSAPVAILLAGTVHPFWFRYIQAIRANDINLSKASIIKVKALFFYAFIIALTCELLSESSFIDIFFKH